MTRDLSTASAATYAGHVRTEAAESPWAIYDSGGNLVFLSLAQGEDQMWTWYLGWPSPMEIADAKKRGMFCLQVTVS